MFKRTAVPPDRITDRWSRGSRLIATDVEVHALIEAERLFGLGIGFVDAHLLAALRRTPGVRLWTLDKRLATVAERIGVRCALGELNTRDNSKLRKR